MPCDSRQAEVSVRRTDVHVYWKDPHQPNGVIVTVEIEYHLVDKEAPGFRCVFHVEAESGETCDRIALNRGVSQSDIRKWNTDGRLRMGDAVCVNAVQTGATGSDASRRNSNQDSQRHRGRERSDSCQRQATSE
ncbi:uncharacterized protein LOC129602145 [Paramacrobiotus metropolitanus]|uniref:uncharacterized protein LOC129602145 n=1 Tax=Paramacrobiotus metropolitanus TaxID=2943436 RepID=UPI00244577A5|nr:uncharacterized protein LOC129602145 [Paramacrobiotus metropolitanus]